MVGRSLPPDELRRISQSQSLKRRIRQSRRDRRQRPSSRAARRVPIARQHRRHSGPGPFEDTHGKRVCVCVCVCVCVGVNEEAWHDTRLPSCLRPHDRRRHGPLSTQSSKNPTRRFSSRMNAASPAGHAVPPPPEPPPVGSASCSQHFGALCGERRHRRRVGISKCAVRAIGAVRVIRH